MFVIDTTDPTIVLSIKNIKINEKHMPRHFRHWLRPTSLRQELSRERAIIEIWMSCLIAHKLANFHQVHMTFVNVLQNSCPATKQLSSLLTKILTVIKTGLEKYCSIKTSHTGVNNMWILKNSTNLLSSLGHLGVHKATSIQTFDFSTLYTSIPHDLLKSRMNNIKTMPLNTKMELHDILTSKLAEIKAISPVIL